MQSTYAVKISSNTIKGKIIAAGIDTISDIGYQKASLAKIAEAADTNKSVVLYHFISRDRLIEQVVHHIYETGAKIIGPAIASVSTPSEKLDTYITSNLDFMRQRPNYVVAAVEIFTYAQTALGEKARAGSISADILSPIETILTAGQNDGSFRPFAVRPMAITIRQAIDVVPQQLRLNPDLDLESYTAELVTIFINATKKEQ